MQRIQQECLSMEKLSGSIAEGFSLLKTVMLQTAGPFLRRTIISFILVLTLLVPFQVRLVIMDHLLAATLALSLHNMTMT